MKFLAKHKKELVITITAVVVAILDLLKVFGTDIQIEQDGVYAVVSCVMGGLVWFYNMPTSPEGDAAKEILKQMKSTAMKLTETSEEPDDAEVKETK